MSASSWVAPKVASTTKSSRSAVSMACSLWAETLWSMSLPAVSHPPVSMSRNSQPCQSTATSLRSRVTPGRASTMAALRPAILLSKVDLPTLGRPTMATLGRRLFCRSPMI